MNRGWCSSIHNYTLLGTAAFLLANFSSTFQCTLRVGCASLWTYLDRLGTVHRTTTLTTCLKTFICFTVHHLTLSFQTALLTFLGRTWHGLDTIKISFLLALLSSIAHHITYTGLANLTTIFLCSTGYIDIPITIRGRACLIAAIKTWFTGCVTFTFRQTTSLFAFARKCCNSITGSQCGFYSIGQTQDHEDVSNLLHA